MGLRLITHADPRGTDKWGSGAFGASRGKHKHEGIDYRADPGDLCLPMKPGVVTKVGYPYANDFSFRYVEVEDFEGYKARYFYVDPVVKEGDHVSLLSPLGVVQSLNGRYPGIKDHVHVEVISPDNRVINPESYYG